MTTASEVCECECLVTSFVFGIVDFLGLAALEWFFSSQSFHFVNKYLVSFYFPHLRYFVVHEHTLGCLEVIIYFSIGIKA
jgi:hypothetical protein